MVDRSERAVDALPPFVAVAPEGTDKGALTRISPTQLMAEDAPAGQAPAAQDSPCPAPASVWYGSDDRWPLLGLLVVSAAASLWCAAYTVDDAYIYLRHADQWLRTGRPTWEPTLRTSQGFTSPLWQGLALINHALGAGIAGVKVCGALLQLAVCIAVYRVLRVGTFGVALSPWRSWLAALALACSPTLALSAVAGLETPLDAFYALLLAGVLVSPLAEHQRALGQLAVGGLVGLAAWVRPDLAIAAGCGLAARVLLGLWHKTIAWRQVALLTVGVTLPVLAWVALALHWFGTVVPNPARIKLGIDRGLLPGLLAVRGAVFFRVLPLVLAWPLLQAPGQAPSPAQRQQAGRALAVVGAMLASHMLLMLRVFHEMNFADRFHARVLPWTILMGAAALVWLNDRSFPRIAANLQHRWLALLAAVPLLADAAMAAREVPISRQRGMDLHKAHYEIGRLAAACHPDPRLLLVTHDSGATPFAWRGRAFDLGGLATIEGLALRGDYPDLMASDDLLLVHRVDQDGAHSRWTVAATCQRMRTLGGLPYMDYWMQALVSREWASRDPRNEAFVQCMQRGLQERPAALFRESCSKLGLGTAQMGQPPQSPSQVH